MWSSSSSRCRRRIRRGCASCATGARCRSSPTNRASWRATSRSSPAWWMGSTSSSPSAAGRAKRCKMAAVARAHGMLVMMGCMIETSVGITTAAHLAPLLDYADLDGAALVANDPYTRRDDRWRRDQDPHRTGARRHAQMTGARFVDVALPLPLFQTFTYSVPAQAPAPPVAGSRVLVPVRGRRVLGIVLGTATGDGVRNPKEYPRRSRRRAGDPGGAARARALDRGVLHRADRARAARDAAVAAERRRGAPSRAADAAARADRGGPALARRARPRSSRAPRGSARCTRRSKALGGVSDTAHLQTQLGFSPAVVKALAERGLITFEQSEVSARSVPRRARSPPPADHEPTTPQREAIARAHAGAAGRAPSCCAASPAAARRSCTSSCSRRSCSSRGRSAIVLVPEIALTPQTVDRFRAVFGDRIAVLHSGLSRRRALRRLARAAQRRQDASPSARARRSSRRSRTSARSSSTRSTRRATRRARRRAITRARSRSCARARRAPSWCSAARRRASRAGATREAGKYALLTLPDRVADAKLPTVEVVDLRATVAPAARREPRAA